MKKFGTFSGVFVPSFEAILGAVVFLLLPMLTGGMGLYPMLIIVLVANTVTFATGFSIADCATNIPSIGGGGLYALSKRSLGLAFGGSIGIQLFIAQSVSIGFYAIGFAEPLQSILADIPFFRQYIELYGLSPLVQKQIIATAIAFIGFLSAIIGADFVSKLQFAIFIALSISIVVLFLSPLIAPVKNGLSVFTSSPNLVGFPLGFGFWAAFAAFFPAVTGIDAGVGMSGNLKKPHTSLTRGTFTAILVTAFVYVLLTLLYSFIRPELLVPVNGTVPSVLDILSEAGIIPLFLLLGILFATGSSALSYFLTAPRTAFALAEDGVFPGFLSFLGKDFVKSGREPRFATILTLLIVLPVIWSGDITQASMIVGICFLLVYGWINAVAFFERVSGNPSFRPTFRGSAWVSLYGAVLCIVIIALFNVWVGIILISTQIILFLLILRYRAGNRVEGVWWGLLFSLIKRILGLIGNIVQGTKNWRPVVSIVTFADKNEVNERLSEVARSIAEYKGMTMTNCLNPLRDQTVIDPGTSAIIDIRGKDPTHTVLALSQAAYPEGLQPNTFLLPVDGRLNLVDLIENLISRGKHVLVYKPGTIMQGVERRIDIWWKGEENGNLMALLANIIQQYILERQKTRVSIRLLRIISSDENREETELQLRTLLLNARLKGEVCLVDNVNSSFIQILLENSKQAELILLGMPGIKMPGIGRMFSLDRLFFSRELHKYDEAPPVLFVKAGSVLDLSE